MNRRTIVLLVAGLLLLLGLAGFYLFLTGGQNVDENRVEEPVEGLIHVRTMYKAGDVNLARPAGIGSDESGNFWVTLRDSQKIVAFNRNGNSDVQWGKRGLEAGSMMVPVGVDGDAATNRVYVTDRSRLRLIAYDTQGTYLWERPILNPLAPAVTQARIAVTTFGPIVALSTQGQVQREVGSRGVSPGQFDYPRGIAPLNDGTYIIADTNNTRVQRIALRGEATASALWVVGRPPFNQEDAGTLFGLPTGVAVDDRGRAFVLDGFRHNIDVLDVRNGRPLHRFENFEGNQDGQFYLPTSIAFLGNNLFAITDTYNDRVQIVRLLVPGDNNVLARNPWIWWLLPLLLLALLASLLGRKRTYATAELLDAARDEGDLRMLAAVYTTIRVLPEVYARYEDVVEEDVAIIDYLVAVEDSDSDEADDAETRLRRAAKPGRWGRLLLPRIRVLVIDDSQSEQFTSEKLKTTTLDEFLAAYAVEGQARTAPVKPEAAADKPDGPSQDDAATAGEPSVEAAAPPIDEVPADEGEN